MLKINVMNQMIFPKLPKRMFKNYFVAPKFQINVSRCSYLMSLTSKSNPHVYYLVIIIFFNIFLFITSV